MSLTLSSKELEYRLDELSNEESPVSLEERFDNAMQEMIAFAWHIMERQRKTGVKISDHERDFQAEGMKQLRLIENVFAIAKKHKRIGNVPNENFDQQLAQKISQKKGTIGNIVAVLPDKPKG